MSDNTRVFALAAVIFGVFCLVTGIAALVLTGGSTFGGVALVTGLLFSAGGAGQLRKGKGKGHL